MRNIEIRRRQGVGRIILVHSKTFPVYYQISQSGFLGKVEAGQGGLSPDPHK